MVNRHVGTTGECPICHLVPEDIMHLLFKFPTLASLWGSLSISSLISDAAATDRSGSAVLEFILSKKEASLPGFDVGQKEVILVGAWYLWWIRKRRTNEEFVPLMRHCRLSILSICANAAKMRRQPINNDARWFKPVPRQIKVNVDGSFPP
jgi:hypothetical protein